MNRKKLTRFTLLIALLTFLLGCSVFAAAPKQVTGLKSSVSGTTITLKWKKVTGAKSYLVCRVDKATGDITATKKVTSASVKLKNCGYTSHYFKVCAVNKAGERGEYSKLLTVKSTLPAPKNFRVYTYGNRAVNLRWSSASHAGGYVIEALNESNKYVALKKVSGKSTTKVSLTKLTAGKTYKLRIRSYAKVKGVEYLGTPSSVIKATIPVYDDEVSQIRNAYYVAKIKANTTATNTKTNKRISLKKNTVVYLTSKSSSTLKGFLKDGTPIRILATKVKITGLDSNPANDYSTSAKEKFINLKGYTSQTSRFIWVSQHKVKVNIFVGSKGKWKLEKVYPCVVGAYNSRTVQGLHRILKSIEHGDYDAPYMWFSPGIANGGTSEEPDGCAFHNQVDKRMSVAASHGCVRVPKKNLIWMYEHCPVGTAVLIY